MVLGNHKFIDIINPDGNGRINLRQRIELNGESFLGVTILSDKNNEFLLIHDKAKYNSKAYVFENMKCDDIFKEEKKEEVRNEGNPIIDVFYEAYERFGEYTDG